MVTNVPIARTFRETVLARARRDTRFRSAMLTEAINELLNGDLDAGRAMLRDYVNASVTLRTGKPSTHAGPKRQPHCREPVRDN